MAQSKFGNNLRGATDVNAKAQNHWETSVVEPGAKKTKAESESNSVSQYETGSGKPAGKLGGLPSHE